MRASVALLLVAACASSNSVRRTLVTDDIHAGEAREEVETWHDAHGWCRGPSASWADTFTACHVAMLAKDTPPVSTRVDYIDGRVTVVSVLVPVPCRVTSLCDKVDPDGDLPSMQRRTLDALAVELVARYGPPTMRGPQRGRMIWMMRREVVSLDLVRNGTAVVEMHAFLRPHVPDDVVIPDDAVMPPAPTKSPFAALKRD